MRPREGIKIPFEKIAREKSARINTSQKQHSKRVSRRGSRKHTIGDRESPQVFRTQSTRSPPRELLSSPSSRLRYSRFLLVTKRYSPVDVGG